MTHHLNHARIELLATSNLRPNPRNARKHSAKQIRQIAASIERFGWLVPIVIDAEMMIAAGHGRWEAAKLIGLASVPVIRAEFLTDEDGRAFALGKDAPVHRAVEAIGSVRSRRILGGLHHRYYRDGRG